MRKAMVVLALAVAPLLGAESIVVTLACEAAVCTEEGPADEWDLPACADERLHTALIANLEQGDRSALMLLRARYKTADTYRERHRLAAALLGHVKNDKAMWNELFENAKIAVRFPKTAEGDATPEYEQYCLERNVDPEKLRRMTLNALGHVAKDARARALLHDALKTTDKDLVFEGIFGLAMQRDAASLPAIEEVLKRDAEESPWLALALAYFASAEADAIAFRYLAEDEHENYITSRNEVIERR